MKLLISQIEFEEIIGLQEPPAGTVHPPFTVVYFTASWCSACRNLDIPALETALSGVNLLKCDVDTNNYTAGYCQVRSIPSFVAVSNKKIVGTLQSSNTAKVIEWVHGHLASATAK